jgi:hypothetical protein
MNTSLILSILSFLILSPMAFAQEQVAKSCVIAVSDLQLQEIAASSEQVQDAQNLIQSEVEKLGYTLESYEAMNNDRARELTGRALFLEYLGATSRTQECSKNTKFQTAATQMNLALANLAAKGKILARAEGRATIDAMSCRKLASIAPSSFEQANRLKGLSEALKLLPRCEKMSQKQPGTWIF